MNIAVIIINVTAIIPNSVAPLELNEDVLP